MYVYPNLETLFSMPYSMVLFVLSDMKFIASVITQN
jgi:hypothetical protein